MDGDTPALSKEHTAYFKSKGVHKVTENVYHAFGYGLANLVILEGPESLVLVDVGGSYGMARTILKDLREITLKPISDFIYTHHHGDHIKGTTGFIEDQSNPPNIWAHETFLDYTNYANTSPRTRAGMYSQFGILSIKKDPEAIGNQGLGPNIDLTNVFGTPEEKRKSCRVLPNKLLKGKRNTLIIGGIPLTLLHLPGETKDHLVVWWEEKRVLCPGDNIYRCFPSLYSIRGVYPRSALVWVSSLEEMAALKPLFVCPAHSGVMEGEEEVAQIFRVYIDGITFVHDQTLRFINRGMHPIEVAKNVTLPPSMVAHPYLQEHYGKFEWNIRNIYVNYFGWFSGSDLLELSPYLPEERSQKLVDLVGKVKLVSAAEEAMTSGDTWWAIELTTHVLNKEKENIKAWDIRCSALDRLAKQQVSSHARSIFLTFAEKEWDFRAVAVETRRNVLDKMPTPDIFRTLKWNVIPENADVIIDVLQLDLTDQTDGVYYLYFSHAVLMYVRGEAGEKSRIKFTGNIQAFREYFKGVRNPAAIRQDAEVNFEGDTEEFIKFLNCFDKF